MVVREHLVNYFYWSNLTPPFQISMSTMLHKCISLGLDVLEFLVYRCIVNVTRENCFVFLTCLAEGPNLGA